MKKMTLKQAINTGINTVEARLGKRVLRSLPQRVDVVLTKSCNLSCVFCKDYETPGAKQISINNFEKVARELFPTAHQLNICSGGEPYLYRNIEELLRIARRYKVSTFVLSNGMLLKEARMRTIIREGLISRHGFSVDGFKAATVEGIRINSKLERVIENIRMVIRIREEEKKQSPDILIRYALMRSNIEELPDAIHLWGDMGVERMDCNYISLCNDIDENESLFFHQDLMQEVFREARRAAAYYPQISLSLPNTVKEEQSALENPRPCRVPWEFAYIDTDGRVLPCHCSWGVIDMGNYYEDSELSFREIWNSRAYQSLRSTVNNDSVKKQYTYCAKCEARFGMGDIVSHLGDQNWMENIDLDILDKARVRAYRSRKKYEKAASPASRTDKSTIRSHHS